MSHHPDPGQISSFIDDELAESERPALEQHLQDCAECSVVRDSLVSVSVRLSRLEPVQLTADERRILNRGLAQNTRARKAPWLSGRWVLAGGMTAAAAAFVFILGPFSGTPAPNYREAVRLGALSLESDDQIKDAVIDQPGVRSGLGKYTVAAGLDEAESDKDSETQSSKRTKGAADLAAPPSQDSAGDSSARQFVQPEAGAPQSDAEQAAKGPAAALEPAPADFSRAAGESCLRKIRATQPYSMAPLLAKPSTYKGAQAWLLVYAWTPLTKSDAPLDRLQVWVVPAGDCASLEGGALIEKVLHYSFFKPN